MLQPLPGHLSDGEESATCNGNRCRGVRECDLHPARELSRYCSASRSTRSELTLSAALARASGVVEVAIDVRRDHGASMLTKAEESALATTYFFVDRLSLIPRQR